MHDSLSAPINRRQTLAGLGASLGAGAASLALPISPAAAETIIAGPRDDAPAALIASIGENLLAHSPEGATSLGIDTGDHAAMRGKLGDRSAAGQKAVADTLKAAGARGLSAPDSLIHKACSQMEARVADARERTSDV